MPNLVPPITTKEEVISYKNRILEAIGDDKFTPYMTLFFKNTYTKTFLKLIIIFVCIMQVFIFGKMLTNMLRDIKYVTVEL